jgi:hypothetical protein
VTGSPTTMTRPRPRTWRLSGDVRKWTLLTHLVSSTGWIGADLVFLILSITGYTSGDPMLRAACYRAIGTFAVWLLLPLGLLSLTTGLLLGIGSKYGLLRYWWVATKLVINLVLLVLVLVALRPVVAHAAAASQHVDPTLGSRLGAAPRNLLFPPIVSICALCFATYLGVFKPWGRTPRGAARGSRTLAATERTEGLSS